MDKSHKILATLLALIISTMAVTPAFAAPLPPAIWTEPASISLNTGSYGIGYKFNVTVYISTTGPTYTWQVKVHFNPAHIKADRAVYTAGGTSQFFSGHGTVPVTPIIDNTTGYVVHGESLVGSDSVPAGSGTLFWIEFEVVAVPGVGGSLHSLIDPTDPTDTFILDPNLDSVPGVSFGYTTYDFTWTAPPAVHLQVVNYTSNDFGFPPPTHVVGTTFVNDVVIKGVNAGWYLGNATTHVSYNTTLLSVTNVAFDPIWGTTSYVNNPGDLYLEVKNPTSNPSGDVVIAHVTFQILYQGDAPPRPFPTAPGSWDDTYLHPFDYTVFSTANIPVTTTPAVDGYVRIYVYQSLVPPYLEVSSASVGPGPSVGQLFNVTVTIHDVSEFLNLVGVQFRLSYPASLIEPVATYEGPFMPYWASQQPGSLGTFYIAYFEPDGIYGPHVLVGNMIFPDGNGTWHAPMAKGTGVLATITFRVIYQSFGEPDLSGPLNIVQQLSIGLDNLQDQNIVEVPMLPPVNGMYTITTNLPGRAIDVYGGAVNSGYGPLTGYYLQFPAPYGGQGPQAPMDLVEDQSYVWLHANVTYNYWPVQHKMVGFQINYPDGSLYANLFAYTDENGVATVGFRMPWPCENPESLFGVWHVIASVQLADVYLQDTMDYHYDYLVRIWKVTTDKYQYNHGETVEVCVTFGSHAQQDYPILLKVHIADELGVIFGHFEIATHVGGTVFCQYRNTTLSGGIWIPKWAYAGIATVHVNIFDKEPILGGAPWTPEYTPPPTIAIQPY